MHVKIENKEYISSLQIANYLYYLAVLAASVESNLPEIALR